MRSLSRSVLSTSTRNTVVSGVIICAGPSEPISLRLVCFVPQPDHRLCQIVLIAENAEAGRAEHEVTAASRFEPEPAGCEHPQDVRARKYQDVAPDGANALDCPVGPRPCLVRVFASRSAVAEQKPARALGVYVGGAAALILPVVPFGEVRIGFRQTAEPGQLGGPPRALRRAAEHLDETRSVQPLPEGARLLLAP